MRFYQVDNCPLRVYISGDSMDMGRLKSSLNSKFYRETEYSDEKDITNVIFEDGEDNYFPVGLLGIISSEAQKLGIEIENSVDLSKSTDLGLNDLTPDILEGITLRDYQFEGVKNALIHKSGLLKVATGGGKTEIMIAICKYLLEHREGNILICVPTSNLLHQTHERMILRGIPEYCISKYGDGNKIDVSRRVTIATVQTVYRRLSDEKFQDWYRSILCLMMDEAHHSSCNTWFTIIDKLSPEYNLGVSAEPFYNDKDHIIRDLLLRGIVGPVIHSVPMDYLIEKGYLSKPYMVAVETQYPGNIFKLINWQTVQKSGIVKNPLRNAAICSTAISLIDAGKNPLILVAQIAHGESLAVQISKQSKKVAMITGGSVIKVFLDGQEIDQYRDTEGRAKREFQEGILDVLIGTSIMDEGVDMPAISSVILAGGGKSVLKLVQRVGRGLRPTKHDNTTIIVDFQDKFNLVTRKHFSARKEAMDKLGVKVFYLKEVSKLPELVTCLCDIRP